MIDNARALARALADAGLRIVTGGTDMGLMLVDLAARGLTGDVAAKALERAGLAVNKNMIPFDPRPPEAPSGCAFRATPAPRAASASPNSKRLRDGSTGC